MSETQSITCPVCSLTSYNANDIREGYCGRCHRWTQVPPDSKLPRNQMKGRITPGLWEDMEGNFHWSIQELLQHFDLEDTAEHRARILATLQDTIRKHVPTATFIEREKPD